MALSGFINEQRRWLRRRDSRQRGRWQGPSADIPLYLILAANIAILVASIGIAGWHVVPVRLNPMLGPPQEYLLRVGAVDPGRVTREHQLWRVLTSPFVNAGAHSIDHLAGKVGTLVCFDHSAMTPGIRAVSSGRSPALTYFLAAMLG